MICANCHKKVTYGYFWEGESVKYICTDCLLSYRSGKVKKYDREQIMRMHEKGYSNAYDTVAVEVKQAWSFDTDQWVAISKKYDLDIRLFGFECGMQFMQSIEIINGELTIDECIECDDYVWECPMPLLGG